MIIEEVWFCVRIDRFYHESGRFTCTPLSIRIGHVFLPIVHGAARFDTLRRGA
jgi:hypothetical protein